MKTSELQKLLKEKGLTPEQIAKIVERYERQKERSKKYQREKYYKVSVSVKKHIVDEICRLTGLKHETVKKYVAGMKLIKSVNQKEKEAINEAMRALTKTL